MRRDPVGVFEPVGDVSQDFGFASICIVEAWGIYKCDFILSVLEFVWNYVGGTCGLSRQ